MSTEESQGRNEGPPVGEAWSALADNAMLGAQGTRALEAWLLGPRGENSDLLEELVVEAVRDQIFWRRNYHPDDPLQITEKNKLLPEFQEARAELRQSFQTLLAFLKKSVPFFSMRYQGHMNWDLTLPGIAGYFAAMLYNPNNVAFEGSAATTFLEMLVGDDLCQMLGYPPQLPKRGAVDRPGVITPWGHITCDGTVANIEAIWAARNLKLYPLAVREALRNELREASELMVELPGGGSAPLVDLSSWQTLNLIGDRILELPKRIELEFKLPLEQIDAAIRQYTVQTLGLEEFRRRFLADLPEAPVFFVPGTRHYSFPKAAALLGLGSQNMIDLPVDLDTRQDMGALEQALQSCLERRRPVYAVVAVIGSTEESAVDPLREILKIRERFRRQGLEFIVHADAAWGGYHASVIRPDFRLGEPEDIPVVAAAKVEAAEAPPLPLKRYVREQYEALPGADSITIDPHKSGYIPYPAGALCYRNSAMRNLVSFLAPVVFKGTADPSVGVFGVEGSKPGAAAASVYLSHRVIRPSVSGYGKLIGKALWSCRWLYVLLLTLEEPGDDFVVVPVPRLPWERRNSEPTPEEKDLLAKLQAFVAADGFAGEPESLDRELLQFLSELGPDLNILPYAFNFRSSAGRLNDDLKKANRFNLAIYDRLRVKPMRDIYSYDLLVSSTTLSAAETGPAFLDDFKNRLGVGSSRGDKVEVLRSVVMDPWLTETIKSFSFLGVLRREFRKVLRAAVAEMHRTEQEG